MHEHRAPASIHTHCTARLGAKCDITPQPLPTLNLAMIAASRARSFVFSMSKLSRDLSMWRTTGPLCSSIASGMVRSKKWSIARLVAVILLLGTARQGQTGGERVHTHHHHHHHTTHRRAIGSRPSVCKAWNFRALLASNLLSNATNDACTSSCATQKQNNEKNATATHGAVNTVTTRRPKRLNNHTKKHTN